MPRYFFHLRNDLNVDDDEGRELPDLQAAHDHAVRAAVDMAAVSVVEHRKVNLHHRIEVADKTGKILFNVEFGEVLTIVS